MIRLSSAHRAAISAHAERACPEECCGFLIGTADRDGCTIVEVRRAANVDEDPRHGYTIAPEEILAVDLEARRLGLDVVGYYHSHPGGTIEPSPRDRQAAWPHTRYVIVEVSSGRAGRVRAWIMTGDGSPFREEEIA